MVIADALFQAGRHADNHHRKISKPVINTHAGDDGDAKMWGTKSPDAIRLLRKRSEAFFPEGKTVNQRGYGAELVEMPRAEIASLMAIASPKS